MDYTIEDLLQLIARHDEHESYYQEKLIELLDRYYVSQASEDAGFYFREIDGSGLLAVFQLGVEKGKAANG